MTLLSHPELVELVKQGIITNVKPEQINAASIDLTLGDFVLLEDWPLHPKLPIRLREREKLSMAKMPTRAGFILDPGDFILTHTQQVFNLPGHISAEYKLKSSMARVGLNHCLAGWADAGWNGSVLTLELMNVTRHHKIEIKEGDAIGQMIFYRHTPVPADRSYAARGSYNNDKTAEGPRFKGDNL